MPISDAGTSRDASVDPVDPPVDPPGSPSDASRQPPPDASQRAPHRARALAESFGADAARYDRTRPRYPASLVDQIAAGLPGPDVLDVGIGTGVSARPFRDRGCRVTGVEPDERMAAVARADGFAVECAAFEAWDAAGRSFDLVLAGMAWHWIDPVGGAAAAAAVLRPGGRLALAWNIAQPPRELAAAFAAVYARVLPGSPLGRMPTDALAAYEPVLARTCDGIRHAAAFTAPRRLRVDWTREYTTAAWVEQASTFGGHSRLTAAQREAVTSGLAAAIDAAGGAVTVRYAAVAIVADRRG